jgi:sialate O-acetylesterase
MNARPNARSLTLGLVVIALGGLGALLPKRPAARLRVSELIADGMVMQREVPVPVWGRAAPGDQVTVTFDGRTHTTKADPRGGWKVTLPAREAGGPYEMTVTAKGERIEVRDILVGDVWVSAGQSNMQWPVADSKDAAREVAAAGDPQIRHFKVPPSWAPRPDSTLAGGSWEPADPEHVGQFTAVGYYFARELRKSVPVPIGLINTTWGGSRIEAWMSAPALGLDWPGLVSEEREYQRRVQDALRARLGAMPMHDGGLVDGRALWADPTLDDRDWGTMAVPSAWDEVGYEAMDGVAWYRTTFYLTDAEARAGVRLALGQIDDSDVSYVNGHEVGRTEHAWNKPRIYAVPASALQPGRNVVAVRVEDTGGGGGIQGAPDSLYVEVGAARRALAGRWRFRVGAAKVKAKGRQPNEVPTLVYNKMVHPLLPYPIKGVIWYQGEANANEYEDAVAYRKLFPDMIRDWRRGWQLGEFPFLFVQLASYMAPDADYMAPDPEPAERSAWAALREAQAAALALPGTAQAVTIDIGDANDIHPKNKQDVGLRLALAARRIAYGQDVIHSGPIYRRHHVRNGRVVLEFDQCEGGPVAKGGSGETPRAVHGFAVAGPDRRFVWAEAVIEGDHVVVWSDRVPDPVAVRYAWGNNPATANLFNQVGLPASPFRTDAW